MAKISVIVVSLIGMPILEECLRALNNQQGSVDCEIIVVCRGVNRAFNQIKENFPRVKMLQPSEKLGVPQLRALGVANACGDFVAITEDCCIPTENWLEEIIKAHKSGYDVVGGAIENGSSDRPVNWAAYVFEYSQMMLPIPDGEVWGLAGNNTSYKREIFNKIDVSIRNDYWEYFLHHELKKLEIRMLSVPTIVVRKRKEFSFVYFVKQRFYFSRSFAGMRRRLILPPRHLIYIAFSPVLPFLMMWRIAKQVLQKKRHIGKFVLSLPILSFFTISYAAGELTGGLFGEGKSLEKVE